MGFLADLMGMLRALLAEALATCLFVFFSVGSVCAAAHQVNQGEDDPLRVINYACAFGFSITVLAFAIGDLSGAHINPAVTLGLMVSFNIGIIKGLMYMLAQFVGGIVGGGLIRLCVGESRYNSGIGLADDIDAGQGFLLEFMGTLFLVFVVFFTAAWSADPSSDDISGNTFATLAPIPIGLTVLIDHLVLGPFTGCGINPARVLGATIYATDFFDTRAGTYYWIYFIGPWCASLVAPLFYFIAYGTIKAGAMAKAKEAAAEAEAEPKK